MGGQPYRYRFQSGASLAVLLTVLVLVSTAAALNQLTSVTGTSLSRERATSRSLADAQAALIAWSVTVPSAAGRWTTPGVLPFPDRNRDGNYDGKGDCVTFGLNDSHLLGRFPWAGHANPCPRMGLNIDVRDGAGERLWYAVSRNLLARGRGGLVNSGMGRPDRANHPWIRLRNSRGEVITESASGEPLAIAA